MCLRIGHKLLRRHVQHGEAVLIDGIQLALEAVVNDLRQRIAVNLFRPLPRNAVELLLRSVDERREHPGRDRRNLVDHIRNLIGVGHNDLVCLFFAEIRKFLQHFGRGAQVQRRLRVRVCKALPRHQDFAVIAVLRVEEVNVAGGDDGLL